MIHVRLTNKKIYANEKNIIEMIKSKKRLQS